MVALLVSSLLIAFAGFTAALSLEEKLANDPMCGIHPMKAVIADIRKASKISFLFSSHQFHNCRCLKVLRWETKSY